MKTLLRSTAFTLSLTFCFGHLSAQGQTPCNGLQGGGDASGMTFWAPDFQDSILVWTSYDENGILAQDSLQQFHNVPLALPLEEGTSFTICTEWYEKSWDWDGLAWCCVEMTWTNGTLVGNPSEPLNIQDISASRFELMPNPAQNNLEVRGLSVQSDISILNLSGHVVWEKQHVEQPSLHVDLSMMPAGIYIVKSSNGWAERLVISR